MGDTKSIGIAYRDQDIDGGAIGTITPSTIKGTTIYATRALGYTTAAYGTVTQSGSKAAGVTLNAPCGTITTSNAQMQPNDQVAFVVTNNQVSSLDTVIVNIASGVTVAFDYIISVVTVTNGAFTINLEKITSPARSDALKVNFSILHVEPV